MSDRTCTTRKARYATEYAVQQWLAHYRRTKHVRTPRMRAYLCDSCAGWHVTKWQQWTKRKANKRRGAWS